MTKPDSSRPSLLAYLQAIGVDSEYLRQSLRLLMEFLIELEVSAAIEAAPYERRASRKAYRNGYRERKWRTDIGDISLRIPKLRKGTYYPTFIASMPDSESLLLALVQDAYVQGVSIATVEDLLRRLGLRAADPSQIADLCQRLDDMVYRFRRRPFKAKYRYLLLDELNLAVRGSDPATILLAVGIQDAGERELLGFELIASGHNGENWSSFLRGLVRRGLEDVEWVVGKDDSHLKQAVRHVFGDVAWEPESVTPALVAAISTLMVDSRPFAESNAPQASLMALFGENLLSANTLISVKQALAQPADAIGTMLDDGLVTADDLWQTDAPLYQLSQSFAA